MAGQIPAKQKVVLHVGCGSWRPNALHSDYDTPEWREIRLDINPAAEPDIVASMTDLSPVDSDSVDAIWNSHALEHLFAHEVPVALREFHRVLRPGGHLFMRMPDLQKVAETLLEVGPHGTAYESPSGAITPLDMFYGHGPSIAKGEHGMQHKTGFTQNSIVTLMKAAGFRSAKAVRNRFDLWARAVK
ncbi:methyltransferase domain-containing protein [Pelagibius sp. CAU 1746]|uniref:class I SAM-dependent methyltransferase n=1 Tax=Pelagibius sp. CAU 1746 TaxID=3140370 RepID=UPI00325A5C26